MAWIEHHGACVAAGQSAPAPAAFLELLAPAGGTAASCVVEVESARGSKLRMELKGMGTSEIAQLLRAFAGQ